MDETANDADQIRRHYAGPGLTQAILDALTQAGRRTDPLDPTDLAAVDEFHLGGEEATRALARDLVLAPGQSVIDLGCGIGGPARAFAARHGCRVAGLDLSADYVATAIALTRRCRLDHLAGFAQASILAPPFADACFDRAALIHVGMNIADKPRLFAEARRILKPGGRIGIYDVMRLGREVLRYPMPWADTAADSAIAPVATYRQALAQAGFALEAEHDRSAMVLALADEQRREIAEYGPPPVGLHLLMGPETRARVANVMDALARGVIAPIALIARAA